MLPIKLWFQYTIQYISSLLNWSVHPTCKWNTAHLPRYEFEHSLSVLVGGNKKTIIVKYIHTEHILQQISC